MVEHLGDIFGEQRALAAGRAFVDLSEREVIAVTGADRLSWIDSLTSQSLARLQPGESAETLLLDPSGRIEYAARVIDDGETTWLLMDAGTGAGFAAFLERMRFMLRVEVADRSAEYATIGMLGAREPAADAVSTLRRDADAPLGQRLLDVSAAPNGVPLVWNDPWTAVQPGGHQYARGAHPGADWSYREVLVERTRLGELADAPQAGTLALEALRIAAWRPRAATELDATAIPHEFDWLRSAVHLAKGCYRGQETVAKVHNLGHPPRRLVLLHLDGSDEVLPAAGDELRLGRPQDDGTVVGRITASARHYELGPIALALVKRSADPASELTVVADAGLVPATQELIVPPDAGAEVEVPRIPRLGAVRR
ncbi:YgfZ/GcvT domain-containing protein [Protaetiibacter larvae]|uniref:Folate-binding protein YgfZ n=1 Tax=Protaetiibacter larvae TaxID=2592654 RepID=A0A5C1Y6E1_9MICO|nr:glycine cleavage T C-terminal barrel domain-containing protein [Protaetiibacter larvae]QEO09356.1 folate-binding protein YgfZ [Protaetiibacter larvae]